MVTIYAVLTGCLCAEYFTLLSYLILLTTPCEATLLNPHKRQGNLGSESLGNLPRVTPRANPATGSQTQASLTLGPALTITVLPM